MLAFSVCFFFRLSLKLFKNVLTPVLCIRSGGFMVLLLRDGNGSEAVKLARGCLASFNLFFVLDQGFSTSALLTLWARSFFTVKLSYAL